MKGKKGVKTHLKERTEIFLRLSIYDNGLRHDMKCLQVTLRRTNSVKVLYEHPIFLSQPGKQPILFTYSLLDYRKVQPVTLYKLTSR